MVRTVIGRVNRPINSSTSLIAAGSGGQLANGTSVVRASSGTIIDQDGHIQSVGNDLPRVTNSTLVGQNLNTNPWLYGAVVGDPGVPPVGMSFGFGLGITGSVIRTGIDSGLPTFDLRIRGIATVTSAIRLLFSDAIPASFNTAYTTSGYVQLIAGSVDNTSLQWEIRDYVDLAGGSLSGSVITPTADPLLQQRVQHTRTLSSVGTNNLRQTFRMATTVDTEYDFTIRFGGIQVEPGTVATVFTLPPEGTQQVSTRYTGNRLLIEEPRTNYFGTQKYSSISQGVLADAADPNGDLTGQSVTANATFSAHYVDKGLSVGIVAGTTYTFSAFLKAGNSKRVAMNMYGTGNATLSTTFLLDGSGSIVVETNSAEYTSGGGSRLPSKIVPWGNGWYRCSITGVPDTAAVTRLCRLQAFDPTNTTTGFSGDGVTPSFYLAWPETEAGGFPTSYIPAPSGLASRASEYGLLTLGSWFNYRPAVTNYARYSNDGSQWFTSATSVTANATTAPDGTVTAAKLVESTANAFHLLINTSTDSFTVGTWILTSVFLKAGERTAAYVQNDSVGKSFRIDLSTGAVSSVSSGCLPIVVAYPNGWYRCGFLNQVTVDGVPGIKTYPFNGVTASYAGDGTSGYYVWGAEIAVMPAPYPNILPRPQRFDEWSTNASPNDSTVVSNAAVAPDGTLTADKIVPSIATGSKSRYYSYTGSVDTTYTASVYIKAAGYNYAALQLGNTAFGANARIVNVDLSAGTIIPINTTDDSNATLTAVGDGWYRVSLRATSLGTGGAYVIVVNVGNPASGALGSFAGDGTSGIYAWGAKIEIGTTLTPYTPLSAQMPIYVPNNTAAAVTRNPPGPSTYLFRGMIPQQHPTAQMGLFAIDDTSFNNRLYAYVYPGTNDIFVVAITGGVQTIAVNVGQHTPGSPLRLAVGYDESGVTASLNGGAAVTASGVVALWSFNRGILGDAYSGVIPMTGEVDAFTFYPYRVSDAQAQAMTT